jgi:hypothetical protein
MGLLYREAEAGIPNVQSHYGTWKVGVRSLTEVRRCRYHEIFEKQETDSSGKGKIAGKLGSLLLLLAVSLCRRCLAIMRLPPIAPPATAPPTTWPLIKFRWTRACTSRGCALVARI